MPSTFETTIGPFSHAMYAVLRYSSDGERYATLQYEAADPGLTADKGMVVEIPQAQQKKVQVIPTLDGNGAVTKWTLDIAASMPPVVQGDAPVSKCYGPCDPYELNCPAGSPTCGPSGTGPLACSVVEIE